MKNFPVLVAEVGTTIASIAVQLLNRPMEAALVKVQGIVAVVAAERGLDDEEHLERRVEQGDCGGREDTQHDEGNAGQDVVLEVIVLDDALGIPH